MMHSSKLLQFLLVSVLLTAGTCLGEADSLSEQVARANAKIDAAISQVRRTGNLAEVLADFDSARQDLETAHDQLLRLQRGDEASFAILRAGDCLRISNRTAEAVVRYQQALEELSQSGNQELKAKAWLGMERAQRLGMHNHQGATEAIREGLLATAQNKDLWQIRVDLLGERAELELADGELEKALLTIGDAISDSEQHGDKERLWGNLYSRSGIHHNLSEGMRQTYVNLPFNSPKAWEACEKLEDEIRNHIDQGASDLERATQISRELGHEAFAQMIAREIPEYQKLRKAFEDIVTTKNLQYDLLRKRNGDAPATQEALMATKEGKVIPMDLLGPALPVSDQQAADNVVAQYRKILEEEKRPESFTWRRRFMEGEFAESDGRVTEALTLYRQAAEMVQQERKTVSDETLRGSFLADKVELYERLVLNLLKRQEYLEAFHWLEQSRSRAMMDMLETINVRFQTPEERSLYADWVAARARSSAARSGAAKAPAGETTEEVLQRIRTKAPKLLELGESEPVSLQQMQSALAAPPSDLVYFILHQGRIVLWHIGPTRTSAKAYYVPTSQLVTLAQSVVASASSRGAFDQQGAERLYFYLAQPAMELMETKRLIVIPPPELNGLPFQLLFDKEKQQFLGEQIALSYSPSASLVAKLKPAQALRSGNVLLMVGPGLSTNGSEAEAIAAAYPRHKIVRGADSSFETLLAEVKGRNAVHIAAHGEYDDRNPMLSHILLASGPQQELQTTAAQLFALPLGDVTTVTLASCSVGKTKVDASNETYGFVRSLLYAGARSVVLPLWKVPDEGAAFWFESFYANAATHDLPEAARLANVAARRHSEFGSHPRFWGGYQLVGR
jgi:CHAT domain-containing protein